MKYRIGIDVGGTFTDFTVVDADGHITLWKEDSTPQSPVDAIETGLAALSTQLGRSLEELLNSTELLVHGTTVAINMLVQRSGPKIGLLCTEGFRDVLHFRDGFKPGRFDLKKKHPVPLVERWLRVGVRERIDARGDVRTELDEVAVRDAARRFRDAEVEAVAVAFLWSIVNPEHELKAAKLLADELPGIPVICSHHVLPEIREWERTSATALSAYVLPKMAGYLSELEATLRDRGLRRPPLVMQINGGCASIPEILSRPVTVLGSGPAAAPAAALYYKRVVGQDLLTVDMGGTTLDVCLIRDGRAQTSRDVQVEDQPIGVAAVEVHSLGAGGGSIAWVDEGGALRVGPRSAGAFPGPAAYGHGGDDATVTDANIVLGYLDPENFLGGRRRLRRELSERVIRERIARPLGLSVEEAALGIIQVVNANMVAGIRRVSVDRGIDPRRFTLVCAGGAGGLHAVELARSLGVPRVFVPTEAGVFCSFGMTVTDVQHDHVAAFHLLTTEPPLPELNQLLADLKTAAIERLLAEGFEGSSIDVEILVDARYPGQVHELTIALPESDFVSSETLEKLVDNFHREHQTQFGYHRPEMPLEVLHWRVTARGEQAAALAPDTADFSLASVSMPRSTREARFAREPSGVPTDIHDLDSFFVGTTVTGPAVIQAPTTTIVLHRDDIASRTRDGFMIDIAAPASRKGELASTAISSSA